MSRLDPPPPPPPSPSPLPPAPPGVVLGLPDGQGSAMSAINTTLTQLAGTFAQDATTTPHDLALLGVLQQLATVVARLVAGGGDQ